MAILGTYTDDDSVSDSDKYLTHDASGDTRLTSADTLKTYVNTNPTITGTVTLPTGSIETADIAEDAVTAAKIDNNSYFHDSYYGTPAAPGEYNWATVKTYDIAALKVGARLLVTANAWGADSSNKAIGVQLTYDTTSLEARNLSAYHNAANLSYVFKKVTGQNSIIVKYGGNFPGTMRSTCTEL